MAMRAPCNKFWKRERVDIVHELFNDKVVRDAKIRSRKSKFRECQVKTVHAKSNFITQLAEIGLLQARTIANDKGTFAFVNVLHLSEALDTLTPPGMQICIGQFRDATKRVICVARKMPNGLWNDLF